MQDDLDLLTSREACELLRISIASLYRWNRAGRLPAVRLGRRLRFRRAALLELLQGGEAA